MIVLLPLALCLALAPTEAPGGEGADLSQGLGHGAREAGWGEPTAIERSTRQALERGLAYLARRQGETLDGSLPVSDAVNERRAPVGVTALGALAFLANGSSPGRGPQGNEVARALDYLVAQAELGPAARYPGYIARVGDGVSKTHGHGFATLALAQAFGMAPRSERLRQALTAAVRLIESSQGAEGGWEYTPFLSANHEGSVTICHVQALRAANNAGIQVSSEVIHRAEDYVLRLQKDDGSFRYTLDDDRNTTVALTAAGVSTLNAAGRYDGSAVRNAVDAIWRMLRLREEGGRQANYPFYERLYLAQAFWQLSDTSHFERWFSEERTRLLSTQGPDGSWGGSEFGRCYATAMNCLVLAVPDGVLPIFQR